jgi:nuclear pore complex protein Nup133
MEMPVRGGKKGTAKRGARGDGATTLAQNDVYSVKMLPSTPKELLKGVEYRGSIAGSHALAITPTKAIIWEYAVHAANSNQRLFDIPFPARPGEPLPFGALVPGVAGSHDLGLFLISATSGKAVYYESVDRAASLGLFHDRKSGVEGSIPIASTEALTDLVSADHAGFIATLSSGRIVQLTLRDAQGKARISSQFLKITEAGAGGVLGSFTGFLKANYRRDLSAVHTRGLSQRGHVQVIGLTERAEILLWDLDWSGRSAFTASIDFRDALLPELKDVASPEFSGYVDNAVAIDFAITDGRSQSRELVSSRAEQPLSLFVLIRVGSQDMHQYFLVDLIISGDRNISVDRIVNLRTYHSDAPLSSQRQPRLVVPKTGHTAFVSFEDATVLVSMSKLEVEGPEAQLQALSLQSQNFEDTIHLRPSYAFQNMCEEQNRGSQASVLSFVKSGGLVRIAATNANSSPGGARIPAKSKIEQAVFHGTLQQGNIIEFSRKSASGHDLGEVEEAVLAISDEILRASTSFTQIISPSPASMEVHLSTKAKALKALVDHVVRSYPALSRSTMWRLLWDAERLAAGQQLWITFEEHITLTTKNGKRKATVLDELCSWFTEEPFATRPELAEEDPARRFFIGGLHHLEKLLHHLRVFLQDFQEDQTKSPQEGFKVVVQANDIWLRTLETAFAFRSEHCGDYGILPELIDDGILSNVVEYTDLPEFWTSTAVQVEHTLRVTNLSRELAKKYFEPEQLDEDGERMAAEVAEDNPRLVQLYCLQYQESINWRSAHRDAKQREYAQQLRDEFHHERYKQLRKLADVGKAEAGMRLAEKYQDMHTLTDMVIAEDQYLEEYSREHDSDKSQIAQFRKDLKLRVKRYFDRYQQQWSNAFFDKLFSSNSSGAKLVRAQVEWQEPLTEYLRAHPSRAKLCWINDVTEVLDYAHASQVLAECAQKQETKLWSKKVELSMSKLALLAAEEAGQSIQGDAVFNGDVRPAQDELTVVQVQERLYKHLLPDIIASMDHQAEVEICMKKYANRVGDFPALRQVLEHSLDLVLDHRTLSVEELVDVLTLMDVEVTTDAEYNFQGSEIYHALIALDGAAAGLPPSRFETLLAVIWKRVYIYDDWAALNIHKKKTDEERTYAIRKSAMWNTIYHCLESDVLRRPDTSIRILTPSECLGAACRPEDLAYRFPNDDLLDPILHDFKIQDEILQGYVADRALDDIATEAVRDAKAFLEEQADEQAEMLAQERHLQESFAEDGGKLNGMNGHLMGANGYGDLEGVEDSDADVEME